MAESVEYALVVLASALFVAGSVATYGSFTSFESEVRFRAEFQAVSTLASAALVNGSSKAALSLPASTISCASGNLSVSAEAMTGSLGIGFPCDFRVTTDDGVHSLAFAVRGSRLTLTVT